MDRINIEELITANLGQVLGRPEMCDDEFDIDQLDKFINGVASDQQLAGFDDVVSVAPPTSHVGVQRLATPAAAVAAHRPQQPPAHIRTHPTHQLSAGDNLQYLQQQYVNSVADSGMIADYDTARNGLLTSAVPLTSAVNQPVVYYDADPANNFYQHDAGIITPASVVGAPAGQLHTGISDQGQFTQCPLSSADSPAAVVPDTSTGALHLSEDVVINALSQQVNLLVDAILQSRAAAAAGGTLPQAVEAGSSRPVGDLGWLNDLLTDASSAAQHVAAAAASPQQLYIDPSSVSAGVPLSATNQTASVPTMSSSPMRQVGLTSPQHAQTTNRVMTAPDVRSVATFNHVHAPPSVGQPSAAVMTGDLSDGQMNATTHALWQGSISPTAVEVSVGVSSNDSHGLTLFPYTPPESGSNDSSSYYCDLSDGSDSATVSSPFSEPLSASTADNKQVLSSQYQFASQSPPDYVIKHPTIVDDPHVRTQSNAASSRSQANKKTSAQLSARQRQMEPENTATSNSVTSNTRKKRKHSLTRKDDLEREFADVKVESGFENSEDEAMSTSDVELTGVGVNNVQTMRWVNHQQGTWSTLLDSHGKEIPTVSFQVECDKGFNFQLFDNSFICQKKNHFQVTVQAGYSSEALARFIRHPDTGSPIPITGFFLHFHGIKVDMPSYQIAIEQSRADRSKQSLDPVSIDLMANKTNKVVVPRLHFSETTANNMRKRGKPNPDQRYFQLVVSLCAHHNNTRFVVAAQSSDKIIVRASNPGQFENDPEMTWMKGKTPDSVFHVGNVGINTDNADEALTVHGNIHLTGRIVAPSDQRVKKDITEVDTTSQLQNISKLKVYSYQYTDEFAEYADLPSYARVDTGVLAQDLREVLPDAVVPTGNVTLSNGEVIEDLLVINKDRIFFENIGAVKELCKVTSKLEMRIDEMEVVNQKLSKLARTNSTRSTVSTSSRICTRHRKLDCKSCLGNQSRLSALGSKTSCSNRCIQMATVILVVVMTLCVVAITTLYVLSKQTVSDTSAENNETDT